VPALLQVAHEQVNIARYVAERIRHGCDNDSYMNARFNASIFSPGLMAELFLKDYVVDKKGGYAFIGMLVHNGLIEREAAEKARTYLARGKNLDTCYWAKNIVIDERAEWLYTFSKIHVHLVRALHTHKLFYSSAALMEALYTLTHFVSDLGSMFTLDPLRMDELEVVKMSLHGINKQLGTSVYLLCRASKTGSPLRPPVPFSDKQYFDRYKFYLQNVLNGVCGAKRRLAHELGVLTSITLKIGDGLPMQRYWDD
jgi:hypothetical protein